MKKFSKYIFMAMFLSLAGNLFAQFEDQMALSGDEIIAKYHEAAGLNKVDFSKAVYVETTTEVMGQSMKMIMISQGEDKFRMTMSVAGQMVILVANGQEGWIYMPMQNKTEDMPKAELKKIQDQASSKNNLNYFAGDMFTFEADGTVMETGKELYKVNIIPVDKKSDIKNMSAYFNTVTGLLDYVSSTTAGVKTKVTVQQYGDFDGIKVPVVSVAEASGQKVTVKIDSVELDYKTDDTTFVKPSATVLK